MPGVISLTVHGEEDAALCSHLSTYRGHVVINLLEREGAEIRWEMRNLLVVWDAHSAAEGDAQIIVDDDAIMLELNTQWVSHVKGDRLRVVGGRGKEERSERGGGILLWK